MSSKFRWFKVLSLFIGQNCIHWGEYLWDSLSINYYAWHSIQVVNTICRKAHPQAWKYHRRNALAILGSRWWQLSPGSPAGCQIELSAALFFISVLCPIQFWCLYKIPLTWVLSIVSVIRVFDQQWCPHFSYINSSGLLIIGEKLISMIYNWFHVWDEHPTSAQNTLEADY